MSRTHTQTVLVVDDDPEVLRYTVATLARAGLRAFPAASGDEAVRMYTKRHAEIDLLLTDIVMANTSGPALVHLLRSRFPEIQALFMSGYRAEHFEQFGDSMQGFRVLSKPFTPNELLRAVREAMEKPASAAPGVA